MTPEFTFVHLAIAVLAGFIFAYFILVRPANSKLAAVRRELSVVENQTFETSDLKNKVQTLTDELRQSESKCATAEAVLKTEQKNFATQLENLDKRFKSVAPEIFRETSEDILKLMSERFKRDQDLSKAEMKARQNEFETFVQPIKDDLKEFNKQIHELEKSREGAYQQVVQQIRNLAETQNDLKSETARLVQSLRQPKTRGRWGEYQLRNVLEMAGMKKNIDYTEQHHLENGEQRLIPDVVIQMPGGKSLVIDAKTPLDAFLNLHDSADDEERRKFTAQHVSQIQSHVRNLASKKYWNSLTTSPDFVVMFIPGEAFYTVAIEHDPNIFEYAISRKVLICTPATLVALVKAIVYGWQQEKLAENTQKVATLGGDLYKRLGVFLTHLENLGKVLNNAVVHYNKGVASLESRVLPTARNFEKLGVAPAGSSLPQMKSIDTSIRPILSQKVDSEAPTEDSAA